MDKKTILERCRKERIRFLRLQFTDILGTNKNVEVPAGQFGKALDGEINFDGSSIEGFVRIEESDLMAWPDLQSFRILPWEVAGQRIACVFCDIKKPDGTPYEGDPRNVLKRHVEMASKLGYTCYMGPEIEYFFFM